MTNDQGCKNTGDASARNATYLGQMQSIPGEIAALGVLYCLASGGSRRQTIADRTPPTHRRFPIPKRK